MDERLSNGQLVSRCADAWEAVPTASWWLHKKTGGVYEAQGVALTSSDLEPVVIYTSMKGGGPSFTRRACEFLDGRFERINDKEGE